VATFAVNGGGTTFWHDAVYSTRAGGDTYNLSLGSVLVVDGDCRFGPNTSEAVGPPLNISIAAESGGEFLVDGRGVRLIPYVSGSGNVPAGGTAITQGAVTGSLLGVWSSINTVPTAAGASMPATGFIKVRQVSGGSSRYGGGALGGIAATAVGDTGASLTLTVAASGKTFTRSAGSFISDGIKLGDTVVVSGCVNAGNNGSFVVTVITSTVLTCAAAAGLVDEVVGGSGRVLSQTSDIAGWIDFSCTDAGAMTVRRLGKLTTRGTWFDLGLTSGSRNQTLPLPTSGQTAFWISGVWIETAPESGAFEYWPCLTTNTGGGWSTAAQGTDERSRAVMCDAANQVIRIGADAAATSIGELPSAGRRVVVPNVFLMTNTSAAKAAASLPSSTLAARFELITTGAAVIDMEYAECNWCCAVSATSFTQCYSCTFTNVSFGDAVFLGECATPVIWNGGGVSPVNPLDLPALTCTSLYYGGVFTDCKFWRGGTIGAADYSVSLTSCTDVTFVRCRIGQATLASNATSYALSVNSCVRSTFTSCWLTMGALLTTSSATSWTTTTYLNRHIGTTATTPSIHCFTLTSRCSDTFIDGLDFGGFTNVHPYPGLLSVTASDQTELRNVGTAASPLSLGSANQTGVLVASGGGCDGIILKRVYTLNTRTGLYTTTSSDKAVVLQNVWGDAADNLGAQWINCIHKGCRGFGTPVVAYTDVYDNIFFDVFNASTTGKVGLFFNEATARGYAEYVTLEGTARFTSTGSIYMPTAGDAATFEWPHYILGFTGFSAVESTLTGGTSVSTRMRVQYQLDTNGGAGYGTLQNLLYNRPGGGGTNGQSTITMTSTSEVAVGDYVFGTNVGTGARVTAVNNGTTITVNVSNSGTVSGTLRFSHLPYETGISASAGFRLKVKISCETTDVVNNNISLFHLQGSTTDDADGNQQAYPLDVVDVVLSNIVVGSRYSILRADGTTLLASGTATGTTETVPVEYPGVAENLVVRARKSSSSTKYLPFETRAPVTRTGGAAAFILQVLDTLAA
jgi:hypothetical protein